MKKNSFTTIVLLVLQTLVILSVPINIFPEYFFLPWLVLHGKIPYRDFFDHHGFLVNYLFAPLSVDTSFMMQTIAFVGLRDINLFLFLQLLRKRSLKSNTLILFGLLYIGLQYYFLENNLWFELFIETFLLSGLLLLHTKKSFLSFVAGGCISLAVATKQTALLFLLPFLLRTQQKKIFFTGFIMILFVLFILLLFSVSLPTVLQDTVIFNSRYPQFFPTSYLYVLRSPLAIFGAGVICVGIILSLVTGFASQLVIDLIFFFCGIFLLYPKFDSVNYAVVIPFGLLLLSSIYKNLRQHQRPVLLFVLVFFFAVTVFYDIHVFLKLRHTIPYATDGQTKNNIATIRTTIGDKEGSLYIYGNQVEYYYFTNHLPVVRYLLLYPWTVSLLPSIEAETISAIDNTAVKYIVVPLPIDGVYREFSQLHQYIRTHYFLIQQTPTLEIYQRRF